MKLSGRFKVDPPELVILAVAGDEQEPALNREAWAPRCSRLLVIGAALANIDDMAQARKPQTDIDRKLDEALDETFPASDPVSIGRNDRPGKPAQSLPDDKDS